MEVGQVSEQPVSGPFGNDDEAAQAALSIIKKDPEFADKAVKPRDESGKFVKEEAPAAKSSESSETEEKAEESKETTETETSQEATEETPSLKFKVKYKSEDGSDVEAEVDQDELIKGYMLEKSYRQKTAQLAREREAVQSKVKEAVEPKLKEYESSLETYKQALLMLADREGANVDLNKLAEQDPAQAQKIFFKRMEFNNALQAINQAQEKLQKERQEEAQKAFKKQAQEAVETLQTEIPGWSDELYGKILKTGVDYGFKKEEVNAITDPRAIKVLNDARQWREFKAAKPASQDKKTVVVPKVAKPGTSEKTDPNADKVKVAKDKLRKTGRAEDAVGWAMEILKRSG